jgi:hypothetical protein
MGSSWDAMNAELTPKDDLERGMRGIDITMAGSGRGVATSLVAGS